MISTLIICITVIICLVLLLKWIKNMSKSGLPMYTYGELVWKEKSNDEPAMVTQPLGFAPPEEEKPKDKTDKEAKEALLSDPITMFSALLRGEVDIDDVTT